MLGFLKKLFGFGRSASAEWLARPQQWDSLQLSDLQEAGRWRWSASEDWSDSEDSDDSSSDLDDLDSSRLDTEFWKFSDSDDDWRQDDWHQDDWHQSDSFDDWADSVLGCGSSLEWD